MPTSGQWVELPIGSKIAADKHPLNLGAEEVLVFRDVTASEVPGSLVLRKISALAAIRPAVETFRIGEQNRPDSTRVLAAVANNGLRTRLFVQNPDNDTWITTFGSVPVDSLGDTGDLSISPDAIRACGEEGLATVVKLGTMPYIEGGEEVMPRQFHQTTGRQAGNYTGLGYVAWNGRVETVNLRGSRNYTPVSATRIDPNGDSVYRRRGRRTAPRVTPAGEDNTYSTWFGASKWVRYYYSITFEGGQESAPIFSDEIINLGAADENWVELTVQAHSDFVPFAAKRINIYRSTGSTSADRPEHPTTAVLIASIPLYKEDEDFEDWGANDEGLRDVWQFKTTDENEASVIGGTYFDRQQLSHEVTELSPYRRRHWLFSDRMFAAGVVADDGKVYGNRLYYSHVNGLGISCYDIIPPANYVEFPFNIAGLVSVRSHRIVIGDTKYAIGYFSGGAIQNWRIYEGETEMGCLAPDSVADTPFGAAYVGYDGIYIVNGLEVQGPLARGIFKPTQSTHDWTLAKGEFAQLEQEYVLVIPSSAGSRGDDMIVAINLKNGSTRTLTPPLGFVQAIGKDSQGKILLATTAAVYRLEDAFGESTSSDGPDPEVAKGYWKATQGSKFQTILRVAVEGTSAPGTLGVRITPYNSSESFTVNLDLAEGGYDSAGVDAHQSPAFAHKFEFFPSTKAGITDFRIDRVWVLVNETDREMA